MTDLNDPATLERLKLQAQKRHVATQALRARNEQRRIVVGRFRCFTGRLFPCPHCDSRLNHALLVKQNMVLETIPYCSVCHHPLVRSDELDAAQAAYVKAQEAELEGTRWRRAE
jgi:transcription elongation factor Elf1